MLPIECVVRGYLSGSGWKDYRSTGEVCGHRLPAGLIESQRLPEPIFTPATRRHRPRREHRPRGGRRAGRGRAVRRGRADGTRAVRVRVGATRSSAGSSSPTRSSSSESTGRGGSCSATRPSHPTRRASGRPTSTGRHAPPSFDKQFVRDYCEALGWDKTDPGPEIPPTWSRARAPATSRRSRP